MKINKRLVIIKSVMTGLVVLLMTQSGFAKEIQYDAFAYGVQLNTPESFTIGEVLLPDDLYRQTYRDDLGDIRVFNQANKMVPHVMIQTSAEVEKLKNSQALNFFPLYADNIKSIQNVYSQVKIDENGVIVNVNGQQQDHSKKQIKGYVIDLTQLKDTLESLRVEWQWKDPAKKGIVKFDIRGSRDLKSWNRVIKRGMLLELEKDGASIKEDIITLSVGKETKYLYFDWSGLDEKMTLKSISGTTYQLKQKESMIWKDASFVKAKGDSGFYNSYGNYQADKIEIMLPHENMIFKARVFGRASKKAKWEQVHYGILYRLRDGNEEIVNKAISIRENDFRFWQIRVMDSQGLVDVSELEMKVGYQPDKVLFMASGSAPFKLAYGNARVLPLETTIESFLNTYDQAEQDRMIAQVTIGEKVELAGPKALKPPLLPSNWHEWLVWLIYLVILGVLGKMVWSIVREMNQVKKKS